MTDHCSECAKAIDPKDPKDSVHVAWDDGEPVYVCWDCCHSAEVDEYWSNFGVGDEEQK